MERNIIEHSFSVSREMKEELWGQKGQVIWLCGPSGSGKSTIASLLEKELYNKKIRSVLMDGDTVRSGLCKDLSFSAEDRNENLRRVAEVAKLIATNGICVICCFITPLEAQRKLIKNIIGADFKLVYLNTSIEVCEERDPKGLYKKARAGEIKNFTGIDAPFEASQLASLSLNTQDLTVEESVQKIMTIF